MCLVRIEKIPKLQTACTTPVAEGMIVATETDEIKQARKAMLELVLAIIRSIARSAMRAASANCRT